MIGVWTTDETNRASIASLASNTGPPGSPLAVLSGCIVRNGMASSTVTQMAKPNTIQGLRFISSNNRALRTSVLPVVSMMHPLNSILTM
jgi:hypothetical protein